MLEWMILPLKRYADFSGRSRRMEYWSFTLLIVLVYLVLGGIMLAGGLPFATLIDPTVTPSAPGPLFYLGAVLLAIFVLAIFVPMIAVVVRRLHDVITHPLSRAIRR